VVNIYEFENRHSCSGQNGLNRLPGKVLKLLAGKQ